MKTERFSEFLTSNKGRTRYEASTNLALPMFVRVKYEKTALKTGCCLKSRKSIRGVFV